MKRLINIILALLLLSTPAFAADVKLSELPTASSMATGDIIPFTSDPGGTPVSKNITRENFALDMHSLLPLLPIATAAGTVDAITADYTPNVSLTDQKMVAFVATGANTSTTPTFSPDGLTARTIVKRGGVALVAGDIPAALAVCIVQYNLANTRWELLNPAQVGNTSVSVNIGDTANANVTLGLTVNQGAADDEILSLKSSDVGHTVTTDTEADTYGLMKKTAATTGGLTIRGVTDADAEGALTLEGIIGATDPTDTNAALVLVGSKQSGTTTAALGAAEEVLQIKNRTTDLVTVLGNGNVGIGKTAPGSKLQAEGASVLLGSLSLSNVYTNSIFSVTESTSHYGMYMGADASSGHAWLQVDNANTAYSLLLNPLGGAVGIGTINPGYKLTIADATANGRGISVAQTATSGTVYGALVEATGASTQNTGLYVKAEGASTNYSIYAVGNAYFSADVSALTFTDRTPFYSGDAVAELAKVKGKDGKIDHASLPVFAQAPKKKDIMEDRIVTKQRPKKDANGQPILDAEGKPVMEDYEVTEKIKIGEEDTIERDLGAMISILTVAVQQLTERLEKLEKK